MCVSCSAYHTRSILPGGGGTVFPIRNVVSMRTADLGAPQKCTFCHLRLLIGTLMHIKLEAERALPGMVWVGASSMRAARH